MALAAPPKELNNGKGQSVPVTEHRGILPKSVPGALALNTQQCNFSLSQNFVFNYIFGAALALTHVLPSKKISKFYLTSTTLFLSAI